MKYTITTIFFYLFTTTTFAMCTITDDIGNHLILKNSASRIISLAPDITEDLFAIGAGDKIMGVVAGSDYPSAAKQIPIVGSYTGLDIEKIILLHPDLIVAWNSAFARQILVLQRMHIPVYVIAPIQLQDIPHTLKNLGCLTGTQLKATKAADQFSKELKDLQQQYNTTSVTKVFYQIGSYSLLTINKSSWINQAIELCGGQNVFTQAKVITPEVSWESIIAANPDVIISDAQQGDWKTRWQRFPNLNAVQHKRLYAIHPDLIDRAGPRLIEGIKQLCKDIHHEGS